MKTQDILQKAWLKPAYVASEQFFADCETAIWSGDLLLEIYDLWQYWYYKLKVVYFQRQKQWSKNQKELDYAISCFQSFSYELHPDHHSLEIYSNEVSKATGILDVLHELNIDIKDSYCFGDGPNDVEMFETVGHPIAMGNAIEDIKKRAEIICPSVQENGVAIQLEKMFNE